jgi:hypothetical protein
VEDQFGLAVRGRRKEIDMDKFFADLGLKKPNAFDWQSGICGLLFAYQHKKMHLKPK